MKRFMFIQLTIVISAMLVFGCVSTPVTKSMGMGGGTGKKSETGEYRKVPTALKGDVKEAEYDLKQANQNLKLAEERVKLSEMKVEKAALEKKYADYSFKLAEILMEKSEIVVELKKAEAVDNAGLGDKEANIKQIANLKTKELNITTAEIKTKADLDTTVVKLKKLDKKIRAQSKKVGSKGSYASVGKKGKKKRN